MRRRFGITQSGLRAHEVTTEEACIIVLVGNKHDPVSLGHGAIDGLTQTTQVVLQVIAFDLEPIDHHFYVMRLVAVQLHSGDDLPDLAIDPHVHEPFLANGLKELFVVSLTASDKRRQEQNFLAGIFVQQQINDLLVRELDHRLAGEV